MESDNVVVATIPRRQKTQKAWVDYKPAGRRAASGGMAKKQDVALATNSEFSYPAREERKRRRAQ